jgi:sulfur carrier protein
MITVNNEPMEHRPGMTVQDILDARNYIFRMLAVSVNGQIVPRKDYKTTRVPDGADVQVIHMISGG